MTMKIEIRDEYVASLENFLNNLPTDSVVVKKSLDEEIDKRIEEYKNDTNISSFNTGIDEIRKKLVSKI